MHRLRCYPAPSLQARFTGFSSLFAGPRFRTETMHVQFSQKTSGVDECAGVVPRGFSNSIARIWQQVAYMPKKPSTRFWASSLRNPPISGGKGLSNTCRPLCAAVSTSITSRLPSPLAGPGGD